MVPEENNTQLIEIINPIDLDGSLEEKATDLYGLANRNLKDVEEICAGLKSVLECKSEASIKTKEKILAKTVRPDTKEKYSWFAVEHLRDSLRFRCTINKLDDICKIIEHLIYLIDNNRFIKSFVKIDTSKFIEP
ncbi:hypothetical protein, partial [Vibrio parahaemolyticus]|uniref:hypothetical protein n=1 Tax=Vibrio parahaemolyticus TaxID=670 RepID=UPI0015DA1631